MPGKVHIIGRTEASGLIANVDEFNLNKLFWVFETENESSCVSVALIDTIHDVKGTCVMEWATDKMIADIQFDKLVWYSRVFNGLEEQLQLKKVKKGSSIPF